MRYRRSLEQVPERFSDGAEQVAAVLDCLIHREPDDSGIWINVARRVALGHRRLSTLDLSYAGHQLMTSLSGDLCRVYNGEIYNFRKPRRELETLGHRFRSDTDTELLLTGYERCGEWQSIRV